MLVDVTSIRDSNLVETNIGFSVTFQISHKAGSVQLEMQAINSYNLLLPLLGGAVLLTNQVDSSVCITLPKLMQYWFEYRRTEQL
jgi:hypothetical protein